LRAVARIVSATPSILVITSALAKRRVVKPRCFQTAIPTLIFFSIMAVPVHLDRQPNRRAKEIEDRIRFTDHVLTPEFVLAKLAIGQRPPQALLRFGRITPHFLRAPQEFRFSFHWNPPPQPSFRPRWVGIAPGNP